ncbi:MAG: hypothetical protein QGD93_03940 [Actinomycetota bacterium]|nr:hypothetical protein [Actinomycetota bacterium]
MPQTENSKGWVPGPTAWVLLVLGYGVAAAMFALRIFRSDQPPSLNLAGAVAFAAVLCIPPTLALFAMRGRPRLFAAAGVLSITLAVGLSVLGLVLIPLGVMWLWMHARSSPEGILRTLGAVIAVLVLGAASFMVLFVHLDPRCADTYTDGTMQILPLGETGMESGWTWDVGGTSTVSSISKPGVVMSSCVSDIVTWAEAAVSLALVVAALGSGRVIAGASVPAAKISVSRDAT